MRAAGARIGLLGVASHGDSRLMSEDDLPFLQDVADRLALAVENMRLKEEIERLRNPPREALPDSASPSSRDASLRSWCSSALD
jgi:GAF domain-containing protein